MNSLEKISFKQKIKSLGIEIIQEKISTASFAMKQAQDSANSDEKSSAGDKHETGRAMGQIDSEMNARQLDEANQELKIINSISTENIHQKIGNGSVVICDDFIFFISLGLGTKNLDAKKIIFLSPIAPIAKIIFGKKSHDEFFMNGKTILIKDVF